MKLDNIYISRRGNCRLGDYGLVIEQVVDEPTIHMRAGTPPYTAPEVGFRCRANKVQLKKFVFALNEKNFERFSLPENCFFFTKRAFFIKPMNDFHNIRE